ncbi:MAG TPA: hypothetical protein VGE65_03905 [Sphingobium sp.]
MINPKDAELTEHHQKLAIALMNSLVRAVAVGDEPANAQDVHKVLALMAGMVLETDSTLTAPSQFREAGAYVGQLVAIMAKLVRDEHERTGFSMMDLAATADESALN